MGNPLLLPSRERWHTTHDTEESSDLQASRRSRTSDPAHSYHKVEVQGNSVKQTLYDTCDTPPTKGQPVLLGLPYESVKAPEFS